MDASACSADCAVWSEGFRNPRIGRDLRKRLEEAGFVDLQVQEVVLSTPGFESSDTVFDIMRSASGLAASSGKEPLEWVANRENAIGAIRFAAL